MILTAREEILIELYRAMAPEQCAQLIMGLRALVEANRVTQDKMKAPIEVVGNLRLLATYGLPTPGVRKRRRPPSVTKPKPRRPDRAQDDTSGDT